MPLKEMKTGKGSVLRQKKMVIISSYFKGETYGLLGPQMAATIIQENTHHDCIVVAVTREDEKGCIKKSLADFFGRERPVIGFSTLSGREELFSLAKELKEEGASTILAGPQADVDYSGEIGWRDHSNRFQGLSEYFTCAIYGPAEQAIDLLENFDGNRWRETPGLIYSKGNARLIQNPKNAWDERYLKKFFR